VPPHEPSTEEVLKYLSLRLITPAQLTRAREAAGLGGDPIDHLLSCKCIVQADVDLARKALRIIEVPSESLDMELARSIPEHLACLYDVIPVEQHDNVIQLAMVDITNVLAIDDIRLITGFDIEPVAATADSIDRAIRRCFGARRRRRRSLACLARCRRCRCGRA
jgi:type IV pilus assembly protein PilB